MMCGCPEIGCYCRPTISSKKKPPRPRPKPKQPKVSKQQPKAATATQLSLF